ncbi:uncharacterized protein LOC110455524 [Mizuhopecten yessoensis]|nr:uncharacterized protein LOC110455524 [Mizuhopecten yessoensis]
MDLDDTTNAQSNQSPKQNDTTDSIYNSIDEYEPNGDQGYAQTCDLPHRSQDVACPVDIPVTSADYLVPEKQQEENSSQWLTENLNPTENYFVLEKDEDRVPSDLTDNDTDTGVVNVNKADTYFMLEEQTNKQNNENVPTDNHFLLEKENEINTKEGTPNDDTYNILNSDINNEKDEITEEDYSHARGAGISQDRRTRETTVEENCEDYDQLFQKPNNNVVYDADNDYDHMNNDDPLTSL